MESEATILEVCIGVMSGLKTLRPGGVRTCKLLQTEVAQQKPHMGVCRELSTVTFLKSQGYKWLSTDVELRAPEVNVEVARAAVASEDASSNRHHVAWHSWNLIARAPFGPAIV